MELLSHQTSIFRSVIDDGKVVYPILWAQGVGCAVMGTSLSLKGEISNM